MEIDTSGYQGVMHMVADKLMEAFEGSGAVNYIEQTFEDKENPERCFVLTMQMTEGLTPCQKLTEAEDRIQELELKLRKAQTVVIEQYNDTLQMESCIKQLEGEISSIPTKEEKTKQ